MSNKSEEVKSSKKLKGNKGMASLADVDLSNR